MSEKIVVNAVVLDYDGQELDVNSKEKVVIGDVQIEKEKEEVVEKDKEQEEVVISNEDGMIV